MEKKGKKEEEIIFIIVELETTGRVVEWIFLSFFFMEILLKLYSYGMREFLESYWNM